MKGQTFLSTFYAITFKHLLYGFLKKARKKEVVVSLEKTMMQLSKKKKGTCEI